MNNDPMNTGTQNERPRTVYCPRCGKELPVLKLTLRYHGGEQELVIDPPKHVDTILARIQAARPELDVDDRR